MKACGKDVRVKGRVLKIASLDADRYEFITDPEAAIRDLRSSGSRVDIFTFMQGLPPAPPQFSYAAEPDNLAALPISTYDKWFDDADRRQGPQHGPAAPRRGACVVREVPFDDLLVRGISRGLQRVAGQAGTAVLALSEGHRARCAGRTRPSSSAARSSPRSSDDRVIGFAKLVADDGRQQAALMQIVSMIAHRDKAPTNALDRPGGAFLRGPRHSVSGLRQFLLRQKGARQPGGLQARQRLPEDRPAQVLRAADPCGPGGSPPGAASSVEGQGAGVGADSAAQGTRGLVRARQRQGRGRRDSAPATSVDVRGAHPSE